VEPSNHGCAGVWWKISLVLVCAVVIAERAFAVEIGLKDGRVLRGKLGKVATLGAPPQMPNADGSGPIQNIILLDDELRRTFVSDRLVREVRPEENRLVDERFVIRQPNVAHAGLKVEVVGQPVRVQPFDEHGRRIFTIATNKGPVDVIQAITELTPQWTKVEGIKYVWDMRIATSSIPHDTLRKILFNQINPNNLDQRKRVARFFLECERYEKAKQILDELPAAFPDKAGLKEELAPWLERIVQLSAKRLFREMALRSAGGQHEFVWNGLSHFPAEGVLGETLQPAREMLQDYETRRARCKEVIRQLRALAKRLKDTISKENLRPILDEIEAEINLNTLDRMAAFLQCADDKQTPDAEKLAYAVSGWLLGADSPKDELPLAISAYKVRGLICKYLAEKSPSERERFCRYMKQESAGDMAIVAKLLANMKPPADPPEPIANKPGYYELEVAGMSKEEPVTYYVQVPPEYDPHRRYPTIVTLHGATTNAEKQINWWAGDWVKGARMGQAMRYGYIVIAPAWTEPRQTRYGYSAREHAAVLNSLRDASRRFSIDTDRVYLTGHSMGGDAAWDIGLAHPDLWAGVIPIVAQADRYCTFYWENARYVPFYVVAGEKDGAKLVNNAKNNLDRWLGRGFNATVIEYRGRGHEDFYEEILRLFDWMKHFQRDFFPRSFACKTMRQWDNFFWWVEIEGLPPRSGVDPADWPPPTGTQAAQVKGKIIGKNGLSVTASSGGATVWISPEMLDFKQRATITVNGRSVRGNQTIKPELRTMLEDVRTRADRQHPFWARVECSTGRVRAEDRSNSGDDR
jgi:pimeloyl-ACP methyl ester carboxylesterase